ncbi:MAG: xanthine dehydrogenase family protein molybdopterin-binding subunit [bacterium]|nr:xanthine dehydrogenase family protein molybdopterin-binding subunit [bacterium]
MSEIPNKIEELPTSEARFVGKAVPRVEDPALITGEVEFIDNVSLPGMLHCAILRSPFAHAKIESIDLEEALELPGVVAIVTGDDAVKWTTPPMTMPEGWGDLPLAANKVRFVGEPVAAVAATSRYIAEDALELIDVDYEPLDVVSDPFAAVEDDDGPLVFEERGNNIMLRRTFTWGEVDQAFAEADHVIEQKFRWNRMGANPSETFGCITQWNPRSLDMTIRASIQAPNFTALARAAVFGLPTNKVRLITHPHGGSFGGKGLPRGIDITAVLSRKAGGKPIKWIEDRVEYLTAGAGQAWDRHYEGKLAVKADGTFTGFHVKLVDDIGANGEGYGSISAAKPLTAFTGPYTIGAAEYDLTLVATNKAPAHPYRGMGPPPHFFVLESLVDMTARQLGIDPAEIRRKNFIQPDQFPYTIPSGNEYDSGQYEAVLDKALEMAGYAKLREEQAKAREQGRLIGVGVISVVEPGVMDPNAYAIIGMPGIGQPEGATVAFDVLGNVTVRVGFSLEGQGQYTLITQLVADYFGLEMSNISVLCLDTQTAPPAYGPGGSRLGVAITGAVLGACGRIRDKMLTVAAGVFQAPKEAVQLKDGIVGIEGVEQAQLPVAAVAGMMLGRSDLLPPEIDPRPEATYAWTAAGRTEPDDQGRAKSYLTAAQSVHIAMVEIDRETGGTQIKGYWVVDDCGTRLNPATLEGQLQGSIAQGIGAALLEEYLYDEEGQPLVTNYMNYLMPTASDVPLAVKGDVVTPSPFTPLGAKGCGEGAIHATPSAVMCAINDALAPLDRQATEVPASPMRIWNLLRDTGAS